MVETKSRWVAHLSLKGFVHLLLDLIEYSNPVLKVYIYIIVLHCVPFQIQHSKNIFIYLLSKFLLQGKQSLEFFVASGMQFQILELTEFKKIPETYIAFPHQQN